MMGRMEDARKQATEVLRINPKYSVEQSAKKVPFKNPVYKENYYEALRKAGLT
jgi:hypothetical protein